jgi:hypothetical protein
MGVPDWKFEMSVTSFPITEADGDNEDRIADQINKYQQTQAAMYDEALSDLGTANISNGEKETLANELVRLRWEEQQ